jgi:FAD/FMN-containing dehydrogenase
MLAPLFALNPGETDWGQRTWWDAYLWYRTTRSLADSLWDQSQYMYWPIDSTILEELATLVERFPTDLDGAKTRIAIMSYVGGAVDDVARSGTAYVHRGALAILKHTIYWPSPPASPKVVQPIAASFKQWSTQVWNVLQGNVSAESYQNFPNPRLRDWQGAYYAENLPRLIDVKRTYDPDNVFRFGQSIPLR